MLTTNTSAPITPTRFTKNYLVNRPAQFRLLFQLGVVTVVFAAILCAVSYYWIINLRPLFDQALQGPATPAAAFQTIANLLLYRLFAIIVLMAIIFVGFGIYLSHRFTGPIWKLERDLNQFLSGRPIDKIQFRTKDEFQALPPLINQLIAGYTRPR